VRKGSLAERGIKNRAGVWEKEGEQHPVTVTGGLGAMAGKKKEVHDRTQPKNKRKERGSAFRA